MCPLSHRKVIFTGAPFIKGGAPEARGFKNHQPEHPAPRPADWHDVNRKIRTIYTVHPDKKTIDR